LWGSSHTASLPILSSKWCLLSTPSTQSRRNPKGCQRRAPWGAGTAIFGERQKFSPCRLRGRAKSRHDFGGQPRVGHIASGVRGWRLLTQCRTQILHNWFINNACSRQEPTRRMNRSAPDNCVCRRLTYFSNNPAFNLVESR